MTRLLSQFFDPNNKNFGSRIGFLGKKTDLDPLVTGMEYDSRAIEAGNLYFALTGLHADGHRFIPQAIERGARVIVHQNELDEYKRDVIYIKVNNSRFAMSGIADAFYGFPSQKLPVIGVTGTEGKSTIVYLVWQLLRLCGRKAGFISTVQYCISDREVWNGEHQTTPEATVIHKRLAEMLDNGLEFAVLEASSHGLSPKTNRLGDVAFDVGIMSNVTHEHLEFHGTWERYRDDKANLFRALDTAGHQKNGKTIPGFGIVNAGDKSADYFVSVTENPVFSYAFSGTDCAKCADISLLSMKSGPDGSEYRIHDQKTDRIIEIKDNLPGAFNAQNVMATLLCVSNLLSVPVGELAGLVPELKPVRGRMTAIQKGQPFEALVDYAHTPSSFETIFPPLRERLDKTGGRIISVFGSAGERDTQKRPEQGRIAASYSDIIVLTDEDPRGEVPMDILEEIALGVNTARKAAAGGGVSSANQINIRNTGTREKDLFLIPCRPSAIRKAFSLAGRGDLVLLLGKGHENSIIYAHETRLYDEIAEAEQALAEAGYRE